MKLNNSSTSIQTGGSIHSKKNISRSHQAFKEKENQVQERILFDLTDFQSYESIPSSPFDTALKESNNTTKKHFFHTKSIASETNSTNSKLPPLNSRYHLTSNVSPEQMLKKKTIKVNSMTTLPRQLPAIDYELLAKEIIQSPNSEDFHRFNKNREKVQDMQQMNNSNPNIYGKLNEVMEREKCMPRKLQVLNTVSDKEVNASGQLSSKGYVKMFAAGLGSTSYQNVKKVNLNQNNLCNEELKILVQQMPKSVQSLELKSNRVSKYGAQSLIQLFTSPSLIELNLEHNYLRDGGLNILLDSFSQNRTLKILNLSHNKIQDQYFEQFGKIMRKNCVLQELYLHYNQITFRGGTHLFKGLMKNQTLKVLDISFNKLGGNDQCTSALCSLIARPHPELIHLDLSHNEFTADNSLQIANNLAFNRILFGFHFEGNDSYTINHRGFLMPKISHQNVDVNQSISDEFNIQEANLKQLELQLQNLQNHEAPLRNEIMRIKGVQIVPQATENCWICQGWVECIFQWKSHKSGNLDSEPMFLHLEFEDYRPSLMEDTPGGFILYRMCPPNQTIRYFYSNPISNVQVYAKDQKTTQTQHHSQLRNFGVSLTYANGTTIISQPLHVVNMIDTGMGNPIFDKNKHYLPTVYCRPRQPERIVEIDPELAKKRVWSIDASVFKDFEADTEAHLEQCLDFDLEASKIAKHIYGSNELIQLKDSIRKVYSQIVSCYKYQASQSCEYEFPRITMPTIQSFFQQSKAMQSIKQVDWEISLISTIVMRDVEHQYFKERCLVRHQFLELIIRLAKDTYLRNGQAKTYAQAFDKITAQNGYLSFIKEYGSAQQWRDERYWIQIMDLSIRFKMPLLKALFNMTSSYSNKSFTKEKFIQLSDFKQLFNSTDLFPDLLNESEIYHSYMQSIMMQVDELNNPRHFQMEFIEFIEALARVAEKLSPNSPNYKDKYLNGKQRRTLPLYVKFEGLLYILYYRLKKLDVDQNIVDKSVLQSHEAKKLGVFLEQEVDEEEDEQLESPQYIIQRLLHEDEGRYSFKDNQSSGSKSRKSSVYRQDSITSGWSKIRNLTRRNTYQNQLSLLKIALIENEMEEKAEFEDGTPLARMKLVNRQLTRSKFDTIKFDGPQYKFDLKE